MTKPHSYLHITGGIGAALLPFAFPWLSPVYGLIIMALGVLAAGKKHFRFAPLLLFAVFTDWQWLSTTWSEHSSEGWGDVIMVLPITANGDVIRDANGKPPVSMTDDANTMLLLQYDDV